MLLEWSNARKRKRRTSFRYSPWSVHSFAGVKCCVNTGHQHSNISFPGSMQGKNQKSDRKTNHQPTSLGSKRFQPSKEITTSGRGQINGFHRRTCRLCHWKQWRIWNRGNYLMDAWQFLSIRRAHDCSIHWKIHDLILNSSKNRKQQGIRTILN